MTAPSAAASRVARSGRSAPARATVSADDSAAVCSTPVQRVHADAAQIPAAVGAEQTRRPQRVDQARHERVTRSNGVHHLHRPGLHAGHSGRAHRERSALSHRHCDDRRAQTQPGLRHLLSRAVRIDPVQVLIAGLDDVASLDKTVDAAARLLFVLDQSRSHIRVECDRGRKVVGIQQRRGSAAAGFEHRCDGSGVCHQRRSHLRCAGQLPVDVEHVLRRSALVQRRQRGRGVIRCVTSRNQLRARLLDVLGNAPTAGIVADVGEEVDAHGRVAPGRPRH